MKIRNRKNERRKIERNSKAKKRGERERKRMSLGMRKR